MQSHASEFHGSFGKQCFVGTHFFPEPVERAAAGHPVVVDQVVAAGDRDDGVFLRNWPIFGMYRSGCMRITAIWRPWAAKVPFARWKGQEVTRLREWS